MPQPNAVSHMTLVRARVGCSDQVQACLNQMIEPTLNAPGCLHFALQHGHSDPLVWQVVGHWLDETSMQAYFNSTTMEVYSKLLQLQVVDSLDFQTFSKALPVPLQMRAS